MKSFKQFINEGVNDPAIFKAVFMAGGPGSGKSFIASNSGLQSLGLRMLCSDKAFEFALANAGLAANPENIMSDRGQSIRKKAKATTTQALDLSIHGRLGIIIDGTGRSYDKIAGQRNGLERLGYDTMMIFVNTDLATAIARDAQRSRSLGAQAVTDMWHEVQNNIGKFQHLFKGNFIVVDNSNGHNIAPILTQTYKKVRRWVNDPHAERNQKTREWILSHRQSYGRNPLRAYEIHI